MEERDFIDFKFGDHWASEFNLVAVSSGDRYSPPVFGSVNPNTTTVAGKVGVYKWKSQVGEKVFNINIAFDKLNGQILNEIKEWLNPFKIDKLIFKEEPYKFYWASLNSAPELNFLPFLEETKIVNGIEFKEGVYKGEFNIQFICADNYGYSEWQSFDENFDYKLNSVNLDEDTVILKNTMDSEIHFNIQGNSTQEVKTGKNIFRLKTATRELNGITFTNNGDESFNLVGSNPDSSVSFELGSIYPPTLLTKGKTYYLYSNYPHNPNTFNVYIAIKNTQGEQMQYPINRVFTIPESEYDISYAVVSAYIASGQTVNYTNAKIMLVESNVIDTDYEAWGPAKPTIENASDIKAVGDDINLCDEQFRQGNFQTLVNTLRVFTTQNYQVKAGKTYTFLTDLDCSIYQYSIGLSNVEFPAPDISNLYYDSGWVKNSRITFTSEQEGYFGISIMRQNSAAIVPEDINDYHFKLVEGISNSEYSPYGMGSVSVETCNKNVLNGVINNASHRGITSNSDNSNLIINGTSTGASSIDGSKFRLKAGTYTMCLKYVTGTINDLIYVRFRIANENTSIRTIAINASNYTEDKTTTFTLEEDMEVVLNTYTQVTGIVVNNLTYKIQIVKGSTADYDFVPHQSEKYIIQTQKPFRAIGDYKDRFVNIDDKWFESHVIERYIFNGTEDFNKSTSTTEIDRYTVTINDLFFVYDTTGSNLMSNHFIGGQNSVGRIWQNGKILAFEYAEYNTTTLEEFKAWLTELYNAGTPVYVDYVLAEPELIECTPEQSKALNTSCYSYPGTTIVNLINDTMPVVSITYVPQQNIYVDFVVSSSNLLNDSSFYYSNDIYKKSYFDEESGNPSTSGISNDRPVYLYNAGTTDANLNLTFDLILPAEDSPLVISIYKAKLSNGSWSIEESPYSQISIEYFTNYKPFVDIFDGDLDNWQIEINSDLCEVYIKHKTDETKIISLNKFNTNQSFLTLANCNFVDYMKPFPTSKLDVNGSAIENTIFNKIIVESAVQNYRLKNANVEWRHTYL